MNFYKLYCINEVFGLKLNKLVILFFILSAFLLISSVGAGNFSDEASSFDNNGTDLVLSADNPKVIYVDDVNGDDLNDGKSQEASVKTFEKALNLANDDDSIQLASGNYTGLKNTRITISKSVNVIGSDDTTFDGNDLDYIFKISDSSKVTFKNIRFINAYKITSHSTNFESMYGGALEIGKSSVFIEKCSFIKNMVDYDDSVNKFNYGGAISNLGDLTIVDSYFDSNIVASTSGLFSYGGAIYNAGNLIVNSTTFNNSRARDFGYGGAIYNDGNLVIDNSVFRNAISTQETKASVLFNAGNCTLKNSLIENNSIARADFLYIYGAIYNYGSLVAYGNIFRNNSGLYEVPNPEYHGSPTVFNVGESILGASIEVSQSSRIGNSYNLSGSIYIIHLPAVIDVMETIPTKAGIFVTHHGVHSIGIVHLTTNLICEACSKVNALVVCADVETTSVLGNSAAKVSNVSIVDDAVTIDIFELNHTGDGVLAVWTSVCCISNS